MRKQKSAAIIFGSILILGLIIIQSCSASVNNGKQSESKAVILDKIVLSSLANPSVNAGQQPSVCSRPNKPIPDKDMGTLSDTISLANTGTISDLDIYLNILHPNVHHLTITLSHISESDPVTLIDKLGCHASNIDVIINDEGPDGNIVNQCDDAPAIHGNRVGGAPPLPLLSTFDDNDINGDWVLTINDNVHIEVGALVEWCLIPTIVESCFELTLNHTGQGSNPIASPANSTSCPVGQYIAGESISLNDATPDSGWRIGSWSNADNDTSTASTNTVTMPASNLMVSVNYTEVIPCYALTLSHTGQGSDPIASPANSASCPLGQYIAGEIVSLSSAIPDLGWIIDSWNSTDNDISIADTNTVTMPANDLTVSVNYTEVVQCYALTLSHTGQGSDPVASPANSASCSAGQYTVGEKISISNATPDSNWKIDGWINTDNDASTENTNTVTMPNEPLTVSVNYVMSETCKAGTFIFKGNTDALSGPPGNIKTFTIDGVNVRVSGWSRDKDTGTFAPAYVGMYPGGLGVTDSVSDGNGWYNHHTVDNSGADNYLLFEFEQPVIPNQFYLNYVVTDTDITVWFGNAPDNVNPFINHQTLGDALLIGLSTEDNPGKGSIRWVDINENSQPGNILVIAAKIGDEDDNFKVEKLEITCSN